MEISSLIIGAVCIVTIVCLFLVAVEFNNIAADKGYSGEKYFWYCLLIPIAGYLLVIALPDRSRKHRTRKESVKEDSCVSNSRPLDNSANGPSDNPLGENPELDDEDETVPGLKKEVIIPAVAVIVIVFLLAVLYVVHLG